MNEEALAHWGAVAPKAKNENLTTSITDLEWSKTTGECGILQLLWVAQLITQDVQVKLSPGLQW